MSCLAVEPALTERPQPAFHACEKRRRFWFLRLGGEHCMRISRQLLDRLRLARLFPGRTDRNAIQRVHAPHAAATCPIHADRKTRWLDQHGKITCHPALDVSRLVTMTTQAPHEHAVAVEIVGL